MKLYDYQQKQVEETIEILKTKDKIVLQLSTGGGKTYISAYIMKWYIETFNKKVAFLCNRTELVDQTMSTLLSIGITSELVVAGKKRYHHQADVYICMEQSLKNRLDKDPMMMNGVGLVVVDESHYQSFKKHIKFFDGKKIIGLTATPVINERETFFKCAYCDDEFYENQICCGVETMEWSRPKAMAHVYDDIVTGASISSLIEFGQLVPVVNAEIESADLSRLETDASGEYTDKSQTLTFGDNGVVMDVVANYEALALGKKTVIFTPNTKINMLVLEQFKNKGYDAKVVDSVNKQDESREEIMKWFRETPNAILINTNTLIAGFDNKEIECIILNRAFSSISSYIQSVGRGGRASQAIFKDHFLCIDLGGNIQRFGSWDADVVDWREIFFNGIGKIKPKKEDAYSVKECDECGFLMARSARVCEGCGLSMDKHIGKEKEERISGEIARIVSDIKPPNGNKIAEYTLSKGENIHFAFKVMINCIKDMFIYHAVSRENYIINKSRGQVRERVKKHILPCYFVLIKRPEFKDDGNRTIDNLVDRAITVLDKFYKIQPAT